MTQIGLSRAFARAGLTDKYVQCRVIPADAGSWRLRFLGVFAAVVLAVACTSTESSTPQVVGGGSIRARMTLEELVERSDLIVVGELDRIEPIPSSSNDLGTIRVEDVLFAKAKPAEPVREAGLVLPSTRGLRSSDQVFYKAGQRGIWFLRTAPGTAPARYLADDPQRLVGEAELAKVRAVVKGRGGTGT